MFGALIEEYGHAIKETIWDIVIAIPGVRVVVNWLKERRDKRRAARRAAAQAKRDAEIAEEQQNNSTAVEIDSGGGGLRRTQSQRSIAASDDEPSTFFGRLINSLQGTSKKRNTSVNPVATCR